MREPGRVEQDPAKVDPCVAVVGVKALRLPIGRGRQLVASASVARRAGRGSSGHRSERVHFGRLCRTAQAIRDPCTLVDSSHERDRQACLPRVSRGSLLIASHQIGGMSAVAPTATSHTVCRISSFLVTALEQVTPQVGLMPVSRGLRKEENGGTAQAWTPSVLVRDATAGDTAGGRYFDTIIHPIDSSALLRGKARSQRRDGALQTRKVRSMRVGQVEVPMPRPLFPTVDRRQSLLPRLRSTSRSGCTECLARQVSEFDLACDCLSGEDVPVDLTRKSRPRSSGDRASVS